jgi:hypothetical protein
VMGELALGADAFPPPEMLLPRLHREMGPPVRRRRPLAVVAAAASVASLRSCVDSGVSPGSSCSNWLASSLSTASNPAKECLQ